MPNDVIVVVDIDAKPKGVETLDILLLSTEGAKDMKTYRDLSVINTDYPNKKVAAMAAALFNQGKTTLATTLIRKVRIAGIEAPTGADAKAKATALVAAVEDIREKDDDWYILLTDQTDAETVEALAAWAEATEPTEAELGAGMEEVAGGSLSEIEADTTSGDVTLSLPGNQGFRLEFDTTSGDLDTGNFSLTHQGKQYTSGDGSCEIQVETTSGDLTLLSQ